MGMTLITVQIRHERRVRLVFTAKLSTAAFQSTGFYAVENLDGRASSPPVVRAFLLSNSPDVVELQLGEDLVPGCRYRFRATGVPDIHGNTTADAFADVLIDKAPAPDMPGARQRPSELDSLLYGLDLAWNGDFVETPNGDLELGGGADGVLTHLGHRIRSNGLPWAPDYGAHPREHLGGSSAGLATLRSAVLVAARRDDRIASFDCTLEPSTAGTVVITGHAVLRGQPAGVKRQWLLRVDHAAPS